jgi:hypothetical protein
MAPLVGLLIFLGAPGAVLPVIASQLGMCMGSMQQVWRVWQQRHNRSLTHVLSMLWCQAPACMGACRV